MNLEVEDKVAVVTGGAKGIGSAIVKSFYAEGATVAILDRNPDIAQSLIEEIGADEKQVFCIPTELTEESACKEAIGKIIERTGRIDYLIHNAGTNDGVGLDSPTEDFFNSLRKNLIHVFALTHHSLNELVRNEGAVINIGSKVAETGQGGTSGYAASKGAVHAMTRAMALDCARDKIRVNSISPGSIRTRLLEYSASQLAGDGKTVEDMIGVFGESHPVGRVGTTAETSSLIAYLCSDAASFITGTDLRIDGGLTAQLSV